MPSNSSDSKSTSWKSSLTSKFYLTSFWLYSVFGKGLTCPLQCSCIQRDGRATVDCKDVGLDRVPLDIQGQPMQLVLDDNPLKHLGHDSFFKTNYHGLNSLYLRNCSLDKIHGESLTNLTILETLDISSNLLTELDNMTFRGLRSLKALDMSRNLITSLGPGIFKGINQLQDLRLSHNRIEYIYNTLFDDIREIRLILLDHNRLFNVLPDPFKRLHNLVTLNLNFNPWNCDCYLRKFVAWQRGKYIVQPPECKTPEKLAGKLWNQLGLREFSCPPQFQMKLQPQDVTKRVSDGTNISLSCVFSGDPEPSVKWMFHPINDTRKYELPLENKERDRYRSTHRSLAPSMNTEYILNIDHVHFMDQGHYMCMATNHAGNAHELFKLEVTISSRRSVPAPAEANAGTESKNNVNPLTDLFLMLVISGLAVVILIILLVAICVYKRRDRMRQEIQQYPATNGYAYQVVDEGNKLPLTIQPQGMTQDDSGYIDNTSEMQYSSTLSRYIRAPIAHIEMDDSKMPLRETAL